MAGPVKKTGGKAGDKMEFNQLSDTSNGMKFKYPDAGQSKSGEEEEPIYSSADSQLIDPTQKELTKKTQLSYRIDETADHVVISLLNPDTGQMIRQIPPEETLKFIQRLNGMRKNVLDELV